MNKRFAAVARPDGSGSAPYYMRLPILSLPGSLSRNKASAFPFWSAADAQKAIDDEENVEMARALDMQFSVETVE